MAKFFQPDFFQTDFFQNAQADLSITDTDVLQRPINCILMGQQAYRERYRTFEGGPPNVRYVPSSLMRRGK